MGLFDQLEGIAASEQHGALFQAVGSLVNQSGGVGGLTQQFEQKGLGGVISSWIGNGANPPINGEQIIQVLGRDKIVALAAEAGLSEDQVASGISKLLPMVIDRLTPNGTIESHSPEAVAGAIGDLKSQAVADSGPAAS